MSKKKIQINIPEPCQKNFAEMIPAKGGNFCDSCEKIVIDFTNMTDQEIANTFIKNKGKICGQFRKDQLDRKINLTPSPINSYRGKAASILLSGFLTAGIANAQNNNQSLTVIENQQIINQSNLETNHKDNIQPSSDSSFVLKFLIEDDLGESLIGASIILKNNNKIGTTSDINGKAELIIPKEITSKDSYTITISYTGYSTQEISYSKNNTNPSHVQLIQMTGGILLGSPIVVVDGTKSYPRTLYAVIKNWFYKFKYYRGDRQENREDRRDERRKKRADRKATQLLKKKSSSKIIQLPTQQFSVSLKNISPNPFSDKINLEIYSEVKGDIQISLFDISGQKFYQVTQGLLIGNQNVFLNLKNIKLENGAYILHLKEKNGQVQSRKVIRASEGNFRLKD